MRKSVSIVVGMAILPLLAQAMEEESTVVEADTMLTLQEVTVNTNFLNANIAPLSLTTISPADINRHPAAPNFVEMLQAVPGVYATPSTGSYGDATLNMRGFKQDNISVLLNGISIQGLTSGSMYWSNWMALSDATHSVQVQKGIGGSMLADCAMGGMVNIVTNHSGAQPAGKLDFQAVQHGLFKTTASFSTGVLKNGWGVNGMLSYVGGDNYVECTSVNTLSYMLTVSKRLGDRNIMIFTALGSPENHDQRNTELSAQEVAQHGVRYSKNWGYLRGKPFSIAHNHYMKPYFTLQHLFNSTKWHLRNSLYFALAHGGGYSTFGADRNKPVMSFLTDDGHIDFDAVLANNVAQTDAAGHTAGSNAIIDYLAGHRQLGGIASGDYLLNDSWKFSMGLQYQYYDTWSKMKIFDLLNADYFAFQGQKFDLGQYIGSRYGRTTHHTSGYVQAHFSSERFAANLGVALYAGAYQRHDDVKNLKSQWVNGMAFSLRGGVVGHLGDDVSLYGNMGYNSRLPYAGIYLASSDLSVTRNVTNEKNFLTEVGIRARWASGDVEVVGYLASWRNKNLSVSVAKQANESAEKYQISGLNALHLGVETSVRQQFAAWLSAKAYATVASWKWKSGGNAIIYDSYSGDVLNEYAIYCDGLHVGDAPQTLLGVQTDVTPGKGWYAHVDLRYQARMYADFEPSTRMTAHKTDAYRLPSCAILNATVGNRFTLRGVECDVFATGRNLTNSTYIERGVDGKMHDLDTFRGYWGMPLTLSFGVSVMF